MQKIRNNTKQSVFSAIAVILLAACSMLIVVGKDNKTVQQTDKDFRHEISPSISIRDTVVVIDSL